MGEFSTNIDDLLMDERLDKVNLNNLDEIHTSALFRYYVRVLLVTEQIIEDFQKIGLKSKLPAEASSLKGFINSVIKHRVSGRNKFHKCNHHIEINFHDFTRKRELSSNSLSLKNYNIKRTNYNNVLMPKLSIIISTIIKCYELMDVELAKDPSFAAKIRREYNE